MATPAVNRLEQGDIFFFYRPKVDVRHVDERADVQRFFMLLAPEDRPAYRLFVIGRKQLPEVRRGETHPEERNWALNVLTTSDRDELRKELMAKTYETETRGERTVGAVRPLGKGRYQLVTHGNHSELVYALEMPERPGAAQEEFQIKGEASYVVSVKNPAVRAPGVPTPREEPRYPPELRHRFGERRWINVEDPALLDYENTQLLLLGARAGSAVQEELGVHLDEEEETLRSAEVCRELKMCKPTRDLKPLFTGMFPDYEDVGAGEPVYHVPEERSPSKAGKRGGRATVRHAPSAAAIAKVLAGIDFPKQKHELVSYGQQHQEAVDASEEILQVLRELPEGLYTSMKDVAKGIGQIR